MYLVPKINLFHTLKLGPQSKESANFLNKSWVIDGTMIVDEYLGTSDGESRSPPLRPRHNLADKQEGPFPFKRLPSDGVRVVHPPQRDKSHSQKRSSDWHQWRTR